MESHSPKKGVIRRISVPWAIVAVLILGVGVGVYSLIEYRNVTDHLARSDRLSDKEEYTGASNSLKFAGRSWVVKVLGIKLSNIKLLSTEIKTRSEDQLIYQDGMEIGNKGDWEEGIARLSEVPTSSFYHLRGQIGIEQFKIAMLGQDLEVEQTNRQTAEKEVERHLLTINLTQSALEKETGEKMKERLAKEESQKEATSQEQRADREQAAKRQAQADATSQKQRADKEEAAKRQAQADATSQKQLADRERAAKNQAQADAATWKQRAEHQEKEMVIGLAATNPRIQLIVSGELKFYFDPLPTYAGSNAFSAVEDIARILSEWRPHGAIMKRVYSANEADLSISWIRDWGRKADGSHTLGQSIFKSHIKVGLGSTNCSDGWQAFDANTVKKVLWHEIGHSMGYGHSSDPNNVMYWATATQFVVEREISEVIAAGWWVTFRLCRGGSYRYSFESDDDYIGFNINVLPPGVSGEVFVAGNGRHYPSCAEVDMVRTWTTCNVGLGSRIYLENISRSKALRLEGEIIALDEPPWPDMEWDDSAFQYDEADLDYYWSLFH